jgi:hypothetical protein
MGNEKKAIKSKKTAFDAIQLVKIVGDGNCLFRALSHQLHGNQLLHKDIRKKVVNSINQNPSLYEMFIEEPIVSYTDRMANNGVYGGNIELVAFCREYSVNICVHQAGNPPWIIAPIESENVLHIAFHAEMQHYSSIANPASISLILINNELDNHLIENNTKMEVRIIETTPFKDLVKIRALLKTFKGDYNKVVGILYTESNEENCMKDFENMIDRGENLLNEIDKNISKTVDIQDKTFISETIQNGRENLSNEIDESNSNKVDNEDKTFISETIQISNDEVKISTVEKPLKMTSRERKALKKKLQKGNALEKKRNWHLKRESSAVPVTAVSKDKQINSLVSELNAIHI